MGSDVGWVRGRGGGSLKRGMWGVQYDQWKRWGRDGGEGCVGMWVGGQRVVWFGCLIPLHIPLFLRNDRAIGLRDHVVGYLRFRVILESQSPLIVISALPFVHSKIGPLQVLWFVVKIALARFEPSSAADLSRLLLVVWVLWVLQVFGHRGVGGQAAGLAVPVPEHVFLGAVVSLEGTLATA